MSDPLRTDPSRAGDAAPDADRDAKIEQLLLAGLDHYLSSQYEQAINVWTRALFLDRSHARARAYIERARSALAERQRESEALLQSGVAAFDRGEGTEARRLLRAAIDQGAPTDQALAILDRLNRLEQGMASLGAAPSVRIGGKSSPLARAPFAKSGAAWAAIVVLALVIIAAAAFGAGAFRSDWRALLDRPLSPVAPAAGSAPDGGPSLPSRGEMALARARALAASGHLRDALVALDGVRITDAQKEEADRLKSDLQRQLIALANASPSATRSSAPEP
jgi:tetratricopeptide (TPR) repeat protein